MKLNFEIIHNTNVNSYTNTYMYMAIINSSPQDLHLMTLGSHGHNVVIRGYSGWDKSTKKGGCWIEEMFANCFFSA